MTRVDVTLEDIVKGHVRSSCACPVAIALKRAVGHTVTVGTTTFTVHPAQRQFNLPNEVQQFIGQFDRSCVRDAFTPFTFHVEIPQEVLA